MAEHRSATGLSEGRRTIDIDVGFDAATGVYYVLTSDLPGLHVEMPTFEGLVEVATDLAPDLMDEPARGARLQFRRMVDLIPANGGNLYPELVRLLQQAGCRFVRHGKGSHEIWFSPLSNRPVTVPRNTTMVRTANGILKDAGLPKHF